MADEDYGTSNTWLRAWLDDYQRWQEEHQIALELEAKLQFMTERCKWLESDNIQKDWALDQEFACGDEHEPLMIKQWVDA